MFEVPGTAYAKALGWGCVCVWELQGDLCTHGRVDEEEDGRGELEGAQWAMSSRALRSD